MSYTLTKDMAQNDIYNSELQYKTIVNKIKKGEYLIKENTHYYIKNSENLKYFEILIKELEFRDISYIRRIQFLKEFRKTAYHTEKDFKDLTREDVKEIVSKLNKVHKTINTRRKYVDLNKAIWKIILPETDEKGRPDDSIVPYPWRIKVHNDKSLIKDRADRITDAEYSKIMNSLNDDVRMQLYFSMIYLNLARPQELCYIKLKDVELYDNYARVRISEHGKEGTKSLQLIDNYHYLVKWLNKHPFNKEEHPEKHLFISREHSKYGRQISPKSANFLLRRKLKKLNIDKRITNYSFKRSGVTSMLINGKPGQEIQRIAGWSSTDQLKTYDIAGQSEYLEQELIERGLVKDSKKAKKLSKKYKICSFCNEINPISDKICNKCSRPLDREDIIKAEEGKDKELNLLKQQMQEMRKQQEQIMKSFLKGIKDKIQK